MKTAKMLHLKLVVKTPEEPKSTDELLLKLNSLNDAESILMDVILGKNEALDDANKQKLGELFNE